MAADLSAAASARGDVARFGQPLPPAALGRPVALVASLPARLFSCQDPFSASFCSTTSSQFRRLEDGVRYLFIYFHTRKAATQLIFLLCNSYTRAYDDSKVCLSENFVVRHFPAPPERNEWITIVRPWRHCLVAASGNGSILVWSRQALSSAITLTPPKKTKRSTSSSTFPSSSSSSSSYLASDPHHCPQQFQLPKPLQSCQVHAIQIWWMVIRDSLCYTGSADGSIKAVDLRSDPLVPVQLITGIASVWSLDVSLSSHLLVAGLQNGCLPILRLHQDAVAATLLPIDLRVKGGVWDVKFVSPTKFACVSDFSFDAMHNVNIFDLAPALNASSEPSSSSSSSEPILLKLPAHKRQIKTLLVVSEAVVVSGADDGNIRAWDISQQRMQWETEAGGRLYDVQVWNNILVGAVTGAENISMIRFWHVSTTHIRFLYDVMLGDVVRIFSMTIHEGVVIVCCATKVVQIEFGKQFALSSSSSSSSSDPTGLGDPHSPTSSGNSSSCLLS